MFLTVIRFSETDESTLGALLIDGHFACFTLEDPYQHRKIPDCTRIPGGIYEVDLQAFGLLHDRFKENYPGIHRGMIHVRNVPGFDGVMFHTGNYAMNTSGCILMGDSAKNNTIADGYIGDSSAAYIRVYPRIAGALAKNQKVMLLIGVPEELIKFEPFNNKNGGEQNV